MYLLIDPQVDPFSPSDDIVGRIAELETLAQRPEYGEKGPRKNRGFNGGCSTVPAIQPAPGQPRSCACSGSGGPSTCVSLFSIRDPRHQQRRPSKEGRRCLFARDLGTVTSARSCWRG
jgi:hypothetical protein